MKSFHENARSQFRSPEYQSRLAIVPPMRCARHEAMLDFIHCRFGEFRIDQTALKALRAIGFTESRALQTLEELHTEGKIVLAGMIVRRPEPEASNNAPRPKTGDR